MKLINYGDERNFVIRPAQVLGLTREFRIKPEIKDVYMAIKCIKQIINVDIPSYLIKKIILMDEVKNGLIAYSSKKDPKDVLAKNIHFCLRRNELSQYFTPFLGYDRFKTPLREIPLQDEFPAK